MVMTILSYAELCELVERGVIDAPMSAVKGASIDVTLHRSGRKEVIGPAIQKVKLYAGESIETVSVDLMPVYTMHSDSVLLASTHETFNMPLDLCAYFSLKSSVGRNFLSHQLAGFIDPGFNGKLTLELKNECQFKKLVIAPGMPIGQIVFHRITPVPLENSYKTHGQYNGQTKATASRGIR
jgi:dCTP deaminase